MSYKMKGNPMQRNFGVGKKSPMAAHKDSPMYKKAESPMYKDSESPMYKKHDGKKYPTGVKESTEQQRIDATQNAKRPDERKREYRPRIKDFNRDEYDKLSTEEKNRVRPKRNTGVKESSVEEFKKGNTGAKSPMKKNGDGKKYPTGVKESSIEEMREATKNAKIPTKFDTKRNDSRKRPIGPEGKSPTKRNDSRKRPIGPEGKSPMKKNGDGKKYPTGVKESTEQQRIDATKNAKMPEGKKYPKGAKTGGLPEGKGIRSARSGRATKSPMNYGGGVQSWAGRKAAKKESARGTRAERQKQDTENRIWKAVESGEGADRGTLRTDKERKKAQGRLDHFGPKSKEQLMKEWVIANKKAGGADKISAKDFIKNYKK
jgi:hypothetical protein